MRRYTVLVPLLVALVVLGFGAVGCGSSESAEANLTKKQYVKRAESICGRTDSKQYQAATKYAKENTGATELELTKEAGLPPLEEELRQIEALPAPTGDDEVLQAMTAQLSRAIEMAKQDPKIILAKTGNPFQDFNRLALRYGLEECISIP